MCTQIIHKNLYLSSSAYKDIQVNQVNGSFNKHNFDNEIDKKGAEKGTLDIDLASFTLYETDGSTPIIAGELKDEYTIVYTQTPTEAKQWTSVKAGGTGNWEVNSGTLAKSYYIVKKTDTTLSMIEVELHTPNGYKLKDTTVNAINHATIYTKIILFNYL